MCEHPFFYTFWEHKSFSWGYWYPCFRLLVTSALGFKARVDPLHAFLLVWSSDSPLVWHLLTVQMSAWQSSLFNPLTYRHVSKHWWRFGLDQGRTHDRPCRMQQARRCKILGHSTSLFVTKQAILCFAKNFARCEQSLKLGYGFVVVFEWT